MKRLKIMWGDTVIVDEDVAQMDWSDSEQRIVVTGHRPRTANGAGLGSLLSHLAKRPTPELVEEAPESV